ncbi:IucA/IucC family protein [Frateuria aurantia]|uniref:Siderophore synthetase component n=1 Tax=Frateuria aurantia (strain ATCC 33424 / DSM 6220 / KCTC 2777 / LMG 1558 / NBRC 3245 / NCIMB 13370) TaxID=767434 RepID=H8KYF6_FRAAD|nr:IucA/IucC family siderophore biosynthesis protein [Frateuria aurantia]AFC86960.1 siderophore synthetase component [Frateuria aurantia DSM 6220]
MTKDAAMDGSSTATSIRHLDPAHWEMANRQLLAKALAEFSHEDLLHPLPSTAGSSGDEYRLGTPDGLVLYRFRARRYALAHWRVDPASLCRTKAGQTAPIELMEFLLEFREMLGLGPEVLPVYMEEISSTLAAACYQLEYPALDAPALAMADFQSIEAGMREGHPAFVANHGRVGFGLDDHQRYAPESARPQSLLWLAVHRRHARFDAIAGLDHASLLLQELGPETIRRFSRQLQSAGSEAGDYLWMPVHPWQWQHKIATAFAADIARRDIIPLGLGEDRYQAQQSIRTWFNRSHPQRAYVKTALSILNMGFMRGLSAEYMVSTPAINQWLARLIHQDPVLRQLEFDILREVAAIGYRQPQYQQATSAGSAYRKMLAALWRESPVPRLQAGQRLMTMAALLHLDRHGQSLLAALVQASGLTPEAWLESYLHAWLSPLLHCFFAYGLVFMPHGENVILVLEQHAVCRIWMKDIGEEIAVMDPEQILPPAVQRIAVQVPDALQPLSIFTDMLDGFLRFMAPIMDVHLDYPEDRFWTAVANCVHRYQQAHPERAARFAASDLFVPQFPRSCLNRLQLRNNLQMVDLADPAGSLQLAGQLPNPIAGIRPPSPAPGVPVHG